MTMVILPHRSEVRMVAKGISKSAFKPRALEYFRAVEQTGRELIITDRGRPVLKIVPYAADPGALLKSLRGSVTGYVDPTEPVDVEAWEVLK